MSETTEPVEGSWGSVLSDAWQAWDRFWFSRMDPTTLSWIRLCCGLVVFYVHLTYSWGLFGYVGPDAWDNQDFATYALREAPYYATAGSWDDTYVVVAKGNYFWSIYYHVTDPTWIVVLHVFFLLNMLAFALGLFTRWTGALAWIGTMSYVQRATSTVFGLDVMMIIVLTYLQIGQAGARYSLDRWLAKWWARRNGLPEPEVTPTYATNFAIRLMQVHFCIVYLAAGTSKLLGSSWWSGQALNYVMLNSAFAPMDKAPYFYLMKKMAQHRWLWETVMSINIVYSVMLELSFSFLVWDRRWRWLMICASVLMHLGIGLFMGLTTFSLMMMVFVCSFIPPETVHRAVANLQERLAAMLYGNRAKSAERAGELVMSR